MSANNAPLSGAKPRSTLKGYFRNGKVPSEQNFADLIDSMVHRDDPQPSPLPQPIPQPQPQPIPAPPPVPGPPDDARPPGLRLGRFDPRGGEAFRLLPRSELLKNCHAPANGEWQDVLCDVSDCFAFEIVACASGLPGSEHCHAITHAIALSSLRGQGTLRQTFSEKKPRVGWRLWRLIWPPRYCQVQFAWVRQAGKFNLQVRTNRNFGLDEEGRPVDIVYHIARLW